MSRLQQIALSLTCGLALSACSAGSNVRPCAPQTCPLAQPVNPSIMVPRKPDLLTRMQAILFESPETATPQSSSSVPASPPSE